jgi:hypothetical protein
MPRIARAHHFVPQGMLAGFTKTGSKDDKLWTIDLVRKREWPSTPKNVGHRRDLYRVDVEGISPDFIEQRLLAPVDGCAVAVIREIERRSSLPSDPSAMEILFLFIALQMTRVPLTRFAVNEIIDQFHRDQISQSLQSREAWARTLAEMQNMGIDTTGMEYSEMCQVLPRVRYQGTQHFHMRIMLEGALEYAPLLRARNWGISVSTSASFICSDRPVILAFTTPPP